MLNEDKLARAKQMAEQANADEKAQSEKLKDWYQSDEYKKIMSDEKRAEAA
jgi:hypothetical protein